MLLTVYVLDVPAQDPLHGGWHVVNPTLGAAGNFPAIWGIISASSQRA